ncbi:MAG: Ig-like domain-containing protein [Verrucomicrobiaceae bacterium]
MKSRLLGALLAFSAIQPVAAQISYTGGTYTQDFNSLQGTTNNTTGVAWTDNSTLPGWYSSHTTYGVTNATLGGAVATFDGTSVAQNVGLFSFGTAASTDRALGSRSTSAVGGMTNIYYGVRLVNNTASTITSFTVAFTGEQWHKNGGTTAHTLPVQYQLGATGISSGTWTAVATFSSPVNTATIATLDGNAAANRRGVAGRITGISWAPGSELWIRVADGNESGNEQSLGIDDFVFTAEDETAVFLNGSSSYVSMGFGATTASLNATSFTVECRFMRTGPGVTASTGTGGVTTALPLVAKGVGEADGTNVDANYFLGIDNATGRLCADFEQLNATNNGTAYAAGQNFPVYGSTVLQNGVFYHVAATYDTPSATWKLYVNGVLETMTQTIPTFAGVQPRNDNVQGVGIGTTVNSSGARAGFFHGIIDEVRIWNYARSGTEIANAKDTKITTATGLLGRYGFDEGTGTTAAGTNATGAAPAGTLAGTVLPVWSNAKAFVANAVPTVAITAPANNASFMAPATVTITADASDTDGTISKVEFFEGASKIGEDTSVPFTFDWTRSNVQTGTYSLTAKATDNGGAVATSAAVSITITPNSNQAPVVTLGAPGNNAAGIGGSVTLNATLSDPENDPLTVTYYGRKTVPAAPGADFSLIQIPDTQFYSENTGRNAVGGSSGAVIGLFNAQTEWIRDNRVTRNIAFTAHMGDMVQNGDTFQQEWINASGAMSLIENQVTTQLPYGIPWGGAPGNHDFGTGGGTGSTTYWNQYFGTSRWAGRSYNGGNYGTDNTSNYQFFRASGLDFIVINLAYRAAADMLLIDWADALLKAYPNHRAIITSHWILGTGNPAPFQGPGQAIYDNLKDNPNLFLMLCGHVHGDGRRSDTFEGRTVHTVLHDYQDATNGGNGFLRIHTFSPSNNTITCETWSPTLNRAATTADVSTYQGVFTMPYNMQTSTTDWVPLGSVNVAGGVTSATLNWTGLQAGSDYEWYATATDSINSASSTASRFSTASNAAPTVAITSPANNSASTAPASFTITADAADSDGSIARVEFYQGSTKLGEDTTAPYEQGVSGLLVGSYAFSAIAVDNSGAATLSSIINVTVNASSPPTVSITAPVNNASFDAPATISITADAADTDGTVSKVEFFNGATKLGEDTTAPYAYDWTGVISGSYTLTARATDNANTSTTSAAIAVTVTNTDNVAPSVSITSPSNNSSAAPSVPLTINATAADTDGTISKVEFFDGATLLGEDTTAPYAFTIASLTAGAHTFTTKALDNDGGTTTSSIVTVTGDPALWAYSQNFDGMGTGTAPPSGWSFYGVFGGANSTYTDSIAIPATAAAGGTLNNTLIASTTIPASTASSNTQGYNFALSTSTTDRALGTSPTSGQFVALQLSVVNGSGSSLTNIRLGYDIRRFTAVATANELPGYVPFYSLDNGVTWNAMPALVQTISTVPNTVGVTTIPPTTITLAAPWADGAALLIRWLDDNAVATSPDQIYGLDNVTITQPIGQVPTVTLTAPANGTVSFVGDSVTLTADATDSDGSITKVEFYQGGTKLGEDTTAPYAYDWSGFSSGTYSLTARAIDNDGNVTTSSAANLTVNAAPGSGTLTRGPYLNQNNHNSIVIRWRSSQSVVGRVRYGTTAGSLTQVVDEASAQTDHVVQLTGLTPYTRYYYSVGSSFDTLAGGSGDVDECSFRTSPTPGTATDTRIWVVGDCGRASQFQRDVRDAYYAWTGARTPDLCLMLGDNAYNSGTDLEYQVGYFDIYPTFFRKMPQWSTLGNHDANNGSTSSTANFPYFDMFTFPTAGECGGVPSGTERYYSFDYGNVHFICLDSQTSSRATNGPMATWLQNDLASTTRTWIVALFHHPPYSKGSHDSDTETQMVEMRTNLCPILEAGGVDLVLVGHSHNYERSIFLDGHYGVSSTLNASMKKNAGNGSISGFTTSGSGVIRTLASGATAAATTAGTFIAGNGAYMKPLTGPRDHFGAVYAVAGSAGEASGGSINHAAMYLCYNSGGTLNLDVNGTTLSATYIEKGATTGTYTTPDNFTIIKQGAADSDGDGLTDEFEIANGLNRNSATDSSNDSDGDGISNLVEFAFGTNPGSSDPGKLEVSGGVITKRGQPDVSITSTTNGVDFKAAFCRRKDQSTAGLTYTVQFSADLSTWQSSTVTPSVIADDGTYQVVTVRYPFFLNDGQKARFFRVTVSPN